MTQMSDTTPVQFYVDTHKVRAVAGNGGDGCISFLSAWCKDHAGPDGGDGGNGGHVIFQATHTVKSLNHCKSVTQAKHGERGFNKECTGKNASHIVVQVPLGTIVKDGTGRVVGDLSKEGVMFVAARGGAGGRGNKFFLTDTEQAPDIAEIGAPGESNSYTLEVRSMAHIGLLGMPNAGKSTLLRALTRARPAVAPYPFTTLKPHIGMVLYNDYEQVAIADLPGLIPGSHKNHGLGIQFLQHVERCRGLVYLLDGTNDPQHQYNTLKHELSQYNSKLTGRQACVVVNKIDLPEARKNFETMAKEVDVMGISAKTGMNLSQLLRNIRVMYDTGRPRRKVKRPYHDKDLPACVQYLIVGTGAAGWAAYRAIVEHDKTAKAITADEKAAITANALPLIRECEKEFGITKEEVLAAKESKNINALKSCFYACFFKKIGVINDAGLYDSDAAKKLHTKYVSDADDLNKLSQISQTCSAVNDQTVSDGANGCERAKLLLSCYMKEKSVVSHITSC